MRYVTLCRASTCYNGRSKLVEEICDSLPTVKVQPSSPAMLVCVMQHVAPLAERRQVGKPVVRWIMVKVRTCQDDLGPTDVTGSVLAHPNAQTPPVAPYGSLSVEPPPVPQMLNCMKVRAGTSLATATRSFEPD